jgi:type II secretory pathway pseudopilin PulG
LVEVSVSVIILLMYRGLFKRREKFCVTIKHKEVTQKVSKKNTGFGLIETLVAVAIFTLVSVSSYAGFTKILQAVQILKIKNSANNLATEQIEIARNLPYTDVGIVDGLPPGKIPRFQYINREGIDFVITTNVRDIDDPFDGQIGQDPNDLSPADYKLVEVNIVCEDCPLDQELKYYGRVSPLNLETQGNNGALFVQVFDSNGKPLQGADVHIENHQASATIIIDETTNNYGMFQIVDAPTGTEAYKIDVSKGDDYSIDKTYTVGAPDNPAPNKPHANVVSGEVTQISFAIDKLSDFEIYTRKNTCERIPNVDLNIVGSKYIGVDVPKFNVNTQTNSNGYLEISDVEWDSYKFNILESGYDLLGSSPILPVELNPDTVQLIDLILTNEDSNALQITVKDASNGLPISDAEVTLSNISNEWKLTTGEGFVEQTDWSDGSGAEYFSEAEFYSSNGNIEYNNPAGDLKLVELGGVYSDSGELVSSIFDMGTTTNFGHFFWNPVDQPAETGENSVRFKIATNDTIDASTTWSFVGPDGSGSSYYEVSGTALASVHHGDRYLRYKAYLSTESTDYTPNVSDVAFTFFPECTPPGQVLFSGLNFDEYTIEVTHPDYQDFSVNGVILNTDWDSYDVNMLFDEE